MPTLGDEVLTYSDMQKRMDPEGKPYKVVEMLDESNPILGDIPWMRSNLPTANRTAQRTSLPTPSLRRLNEGTTSTKSSVENIEDGMAMIDDWSTTDVKLLKLFGNATAARMSEAKAKIQGMGQKCADLIFNGDVLDDDREFNGLAKRLNTLGKRVLDGGGTANRGSIYLVGWGEGKTMGIYPKNTVAGLQHEDHGKTIVHTDNDLGGAKMTAFVDQWMWDCGMARPDPRYSGRIANIDIQDLLTISGNQDQNVLRIESNVVTNLRVIQHRMHNMHNANFVYYMGRSAFEGIDNQLVNYADSNVWRTRDVGGKLLTTFRGVPVKICDKLTNAEAAVA